MNQEFIQHALSNGQEGADWLKNIPDIIKNAEKRWSIRVASPFTLSYNYVAPAVREDGTEAVLKIGFPKDREFQTEIAALQVFQGQGIEQLHEVDQDQAAILIERVIPGTPLSSLENDSEATRILASVMKKLWKPLPTNHDFITVREWMRELPEYMEKHKGGGDIPWHLVTKAHDLFNHLLATAEKSVLVHGDLHHDNILKSQRDTWLAIDPKGIAAEPAYEVAAMIRNPYEKLRHIANPEPLLQKRIHILSEELQLDPARIHQWCLAQTVLSAVWNDGEVKGSDHAIRVAQALDAINV